MPIVLTTNEVIQSGHIWKDVTGEQYHFPNQYRNLITTGTDFIYYRGTKRRNGAKGEMEYFGRGVIGDVWLDPDTEDEPRGRQNWYCTIDQYHEFHSPVLAKDGEVTIETVMHPQNHWRRAVRKLTDEQYDEIVRRGIGGAAAKSDETTQIQIINEAVRNAIPSLGKVSKARIKRHGSNLDPQRAASYSRQSKTTGDAGERLIFQYIRDNMPEAKDLRWIANEGETPGWDIQYRDGSGELICIEVKSSQSKVITGVELTANEWRAAEEVGSNYRLALVGACLSVNPIIEFIEDPFRLSQEGAIQIRQTRVELTWT
jgi:hypothetical protein